LEHPKSQAQVGHAHENGNVEGPKMMKIEVITQFQEL
jgi:hypothetical protein